MAYNPAGPYMGLLQFAQSIWDSVAAHTGLRDIYDPYSQGYNGWTLIDPTGPVRANPIEQWPSCWISLPITGGIAVQ